MSNTDDRFEEFAQRSVPINESHTFFSETRHLFGPWAPVASAAAKAAFAIKNISVAGPIIDLVLALSQVGDAQTELLESIKADTLLLRQEPLQTAATLMGEARRVGSNDKRYSKFLEDAVASLYRAKSLAASSEELAVVQFGLSCAYLTMEMPKDSQYWIEESVQSERNVLEALLKKRLGLGIDTQGRTKVIDKRRVNPHTNPEKRWHKIANKTVDLAMPVVHMGTFHVTQFAQEEINQRIRKTRIETLQRFLYFANTVEAFSDAIAGRSTTKSLELEAVKERDTSETFSRGEIIETWYLHEKESDF